MEMMQRQDLGAGEGVGSRYHELSGCLHQQQASSEAWVLTSSSPFHILCWGLGYPAMKWGRVSQAGWHERGNRVIVIWRGFHFW